MKKRAIALTLATSVLVLSACNNQENEEVIATTKYGDITKEDLYKEMKDAIGVQVVENLILEKALENEYKLTDKEVKEAIDNQKAMYGENFDLYLQQNGVTEEFFEKNVRAQLLQTKMIDSIKVPEEELKTSIERAKTEVNARHILVEDEKTAKDIKKQLSEGADFKKLAKEHSTEPAAAETGGDLGWFGPGKMLPEFEDAVYSMKKGEISEPVKTKFGYHVIELIDTRKPETEIPEDQLKADAENKIKQQLFQEELAKLVKKSEVKIKEKDFEDVLDNFKTESKDDKKEK